MPEDVPLGAGYIGSILHERFPNDYRDAGDLATQEFDTSGHYAQAPGAVMGQPRATDPSGQPPSTAYGQPQYTPGGRVLTDPDVGRELEMRDVPGIGMVAMAPGQHQQFANSIEGMDAVVPVDYPQAGEGGWGVGAVVPVDHYLAGQGGMGDWRGTPFGGMGGLTESIGNLVAGSELNALNSSMFKLQESLVEAYNKLGALETDRLKLAERTAQYPTFIGLLGAAIPTPMGIVNLGTAGALKEGYAALTGYTYMIFTFRNAFGAAAPQLRRVYSAIDSMLVTMDNWLSTWQERISQRKGMAQLFDQIQARHNQLYASTTGMVLDFNNDQYLPTAMVAVEELTGVKADVPKDSGAGIVILSLVTLIIKAVTILVALKIILDIVSEFNTKARLVYEEHATYEKNMEERRKEFAAKRSSEGASPTEIESEWAAIKKREDEAQAKKEKELAEAAPGLDLGAVVGKVLLPVAVVAGVAIVATQLL